MTLHDDYARITPVELAFPDRDAADALFGFGGGAAMAALVMFSTFGAVSGIILAGPRVYYAMARDGVFLSSVSRLHPRFRSPTRAIFLQTVWALKAGMGSPHRWDGEVYALAAAMKLGLHTHGDDEGRPTAEQPANPAEAWRTEPVSRRRRRENKDGEEWIDDTAEGWFDE